MLLPLWVSGFSPAEYVNPFIGTRGGGNTFPGAVAPWGMVSVSPHTLPGAPSGYIRGEPFFYGLGHNHLSGTGCADLGNVILTLAPDTLAIAPELYRTAYRDEAASPGYYEVTLPRLPAVIGVTATERCGLTRIVSAGRDGTTLVLDVGRNLNGTLGGAIRFVTATELEGYSISGGFCGEDNRQPVYFVLRSSRPWSRGRIWKGTGLLLETRATAVDTGIGAVMYFELEAGDTLYVKTGLSYVSVANARENLEAEITAWDFAGTRDATRAKWDQALSRIRVESAERRDLVRFYTALYHMLIHPNQIQDVNGEYPRFRASSSGRAGPAGRYSVFSLWDTYRTLHPLLTLVYPERQLAMVQSLLDMYREGGWLPKWELVSNETYMMVGDPAAIVLADTYLKGITGFDTQVAWEAVRQPLEQAGSEAGQAARPGYHEFLEYRYIPFEQDWSASWWVWGPVSTTLEYCLADWNIARLAEKLGYGDAARRFDTYAGYYRNLFDPATAFIRPRLRNGAWLVPFDSLATEGSGDWEGAGGPGYVEGNAWNYTWFVPHAIDSLMALFGGPGPFAVKLKRCFEEGHFTITNEPDMAYPYLFNYLPGGRPLTRRLVRDILASSFTDGEAGLPGNDDAGTISGWFVFSALGFYPDCPGRPDYQAGIPLFPKAEIRLQPPFYPGQSLVIENRVPPGTEPPRLLITLDGRRLDSGRLNHQDLTAGGRLVYAVHPDD